MEDKKTKLNAKNILDLIKSARISSVQDLIDERVFHYHFHIEKYNIHGVGSDTAEEIAFLKARNELIERVVLHDIRTTNSNS